VIVKLMVEVAALVLWMKSLTIGNEQHKLKVQRLV